MSLCPTGVAYLACLSPPNLTSPPALSSTIIALRKNIGHIAGTVLQGSVVAQGSGLDRVLLLCF